MIRIEQTEVVGWEHAIRGMRNPMNSWDKSDSKYGCRLKKGRDWVNWDLYKDGHITFCDSCRWCEHLCEDAYVENKHKEYIIGPNDLALMKKLAHTGADHRKFMRMIVVYCDITAPLYWWKEFDTYKVGTVANSCSTMHKIHAREFTFDGFSHERMTDGCKDVLADIIEALNFERDNYLETNDKAYWENMIQLLPTSYNQKRTVMLNYEVLSNIYKSRKNHKLDEWREFCHWIETLPYSGLITGKEGEPDG